MAEVDETKVNSLLRPVLARDKAVNVPTTLAAFSLLYGNTQ